jgi:hypothetical protein
MREWACRSIRLIRFKAEVKGLWTLERCEWDTPKAATLIDFAAICMALKLCTCRECCEAMQMREGAAASISSVIATSGRSSVCCVAGPTPYLQKVLVVDGAGRGGEGVGDRVNGGAGSS